jgi:hypothetical protein
MTIHDHICIAFRNYILELMEARLDWGQRYYLNCSNDFQKILNMLDPQCPVFIGHRPRVVIEKTFNDGINMVHQAEKVVVKFEAPEETASPSHIKWTDIK